MPIYTPNLERMSGGTKRERDRALEPIQWDSYAYLFVPRADYIL